MCMVDRDEMRLLQTKSSNLVGLCLTLLEIFEVIRGVESWKMVDDWSLVG